MKNGATANIETQSASVKYNAVMAVYESRPEPEGDGRSTSLNLALVFLLFVSLAIIQTWPLVLHMSDHAMGWPGDSYVMWWNWSLGEFVGDLVFGSYGKHQRIIAPEDRKYLKCRGHFPKANNRKVMLPGLSPAGIR